MKNNFRFRSISTLSHLCVLCGVVLLANCASNAPAVPIETAWNNVDASEKSLRKATKQLQDSLRSAAKDLNITNCGDLSTGALRQSLLTSLQSMKSLNPSLASGALLAKTRVLASAQDLRRDAGSMQIGLNQLIAAMSRGETTPPNREDLSKLMARIKVEAEGATGLINYAQQIADQLARLGG